MKKSAHKYLHKRRFVLILSALILLMIYFFKDSSFILRSVTASAFLIFFYFIDHFFDIRFNIKHYILIIIIAISSLLLSPLYYLYPNYDKVQHFVQPIFICVIVFFMVSKLKLDFKWKLTFTFFIVIGILGLFEIGEYALDHFFDLKLQGVYLRDLHGLDKLNLISDRIDDTMIDLILGVVGSLLFMIYKFGENRFLGRAKKRK